MANRSRQIEVAQPKQGYQETSTYSGYTADAFVSQYFQVGQLLDMWGDLVEGHAENAKDFGDAFSDKMRERGITSYISPDNLSATGFYPPYRTMKFVKRGVATVSVYIATQGKDLYVSWRSFVQGKISSIRLTVWFVVCMLWALPWSLRKEYIIVGDWEFHLDTFLLYLTSWTIISSFLMATYGFYYRRGDWAALWRENVNELQTDDVISLTKAVHYSVIDAADQVGIDTTKLQTREPFHNPRATNPGRRRRRRI